MLTAVLFVYFNMQIHFCCSPRFDCVTSPVLLAKTVSQDITVRFLRDDLAGISLSTELSDGGQGFTYGIVPEVGDLVLWNDDFYEVDSTIENQLFVGKDPGYSYSTDNDSFGSSISIIVKARLKSLREHNDV